VLPDEASPRIARVVTVKTAEGDVHGMTASSFCSVPLRPPLILVCIDHLAGFTCESGRFGVSILREERRLSEFFGLTLNAT
jgi:flavin reductase ActVB